MSLGKNIYRLRTARELSQGSLADALGVSRQSISKWETDGAVPELDKLVKLCDLFRVTLDELVRGTPGAVPAEQPAPVQAAAEEVEMDTVPAVERAAEAFTRRKLVGILLLFFGGIVFMRFPVLGGVNWLLTGFVFASPLLASGAICLTVRQHTGLWCAWAVFLCVAAYLCLSTNMGPLSLWYLFRVTLNRWMDPIGLIIAWCLCAWKLSMLLFTIYWFRKQPFPLSSWRLLLLTIGWVLYLILPLANTALTAAMSAQATRSLFFLLSWLVGILWLGIQAAAVTFTVQAVLTWRRGRKNAQEAG